MEEAADLATIALTQAALKCLHDTPGITERAAANRLSTQLRVYFYRGEITRLVLIASSGDDVLDKTAIDCYRAVPKDAERAQMLDRVELNTFSLFWPILWPAPRPATAAQH